MKNATNIFLLITCWIVMFLLIDVMMKMDETTNKLEDLIDNISQIQSPAD